MTDNIYISAMKISINCW